MDDERMEMKQQDVYMDRLMEALSRVPQAELPKDFDMRLTAALKEEGKAIRAARAASRRKRIWKTAAAMAAVFVVGFVSLSMYNRGDGFFPVDVGSGGTEFSAADKLIDLSDCTQKELCTDTGQGTEEYGVTSDGAEGSQDQSNDNRAATPAVYRYSAGNLGLGRSAGVSDPQEPEQAEAKTSLEDTALKPESGLASPESADGDLAAGGSQKSMDVPSRHGDSFIQQSREQHYYLKMLKETLAGQDYDVVSCKKDSATGNYIFEVAINPTDGDAGETVKTYVGRKGKLKEKPAATEQETVNTGEENAAPGGTEKDDTNESNGDGGSGQGVGEESDCNY